MPLETSLHIIRVQFCYTCDTKTTPLVLVLALTDNTCTSHESLVTGYGERRQHPDGHVVVPENFE